jgi:hypothetical protein
MSTHALSPVAFQRSAELRAARADIRRRVQSGRLPIADLLADPPDAVLGMTVFDVLRLLRRDRSANRWEHHLGRQALRDGINVFVRVGEASPRTRAWAIEHGQRHVVRWRSRQECQS